MWAHHDKFLDIVRENWKMNVIGNLMFRLVQKLNIFKRRLMKLNKKDLGE